MNEQKQIEAMARLDADIYCNKIGINNEHRQDTMRRAYIIKATAQIEMHKCDYLHDHNAVQRVIDGLDSLRLTEYMNELGSIIDPIMVYEVSSGILKATPAQKVEAILKACGKWGETKDEQTSN